MAHSPNIPHVHSLILSAFTLVQETVEELERFKDHKDKEVTDTVCMQH